MMRGLSFGVIFLMVAVCCCSVRKSTEQQLREFGFSYDGSFDYFSWDVSNALCEFRLDSTMSIGGKFPLKLRQQTIPTVPIKERLLFSVSKFVHLDKNYQNITVTINSRSENIDSFWLKGAAVDEYDNIVVLDSIELSHDVWRTDTLKLFCKDAKYLIIKLLAKGCDIFASPQKDQFVWLDKIELSTEKEPYIEATTIPAGKLSKRAVTELKNTISDFPMPFDKKIVALGETMHGSRTITETQIGLIKRLIEEGRCKLIVWEYPMSDALYWDLYIRGEVQKEKMNVIDKFAPESYYDIFPDFLNWLREYNLSHARKVKIMGNMNIDRIVSGSFFYYLDAFYDESSSKMLLPLMEMVARGIDATEYIWANEQVMRTIMGNDNYNAFLYTYSLCKRVPENEFDWLNHRDYHMARISEYNIDACLAEDESAVIVAHTGHTSKKHEYTLWNLHSMGHFLSERYGDDYYSVAITAGLGEFLSREIGKDDSHAQKYSLGIPKGSTLEDLCLAGYDSDLWIETSRLSRPVFAYRRIGNAFVSVNETNTGNIAERFDGVLFVRKSHIFNEKENNTQSTNETILGVEKFTKIFRYRRKSEAIRK